VLGPSAMSDNLKILILFALGFFLGPIGDYCHTISQTTGYPPEVYGYYFFGIPFWVPFLFGTASLAVGVSHPNLDRRLGPSTPRPGEKNGLVASLGVLVFLGLYALSGFLPYKIGPGDDLILAGAALLVWALFDRTWQGIFLGLLTAAIGTGIEILLIKVGAFYYIAPNDSLLGVASWLPSLYFSASVTLGNFGRWLLKGSKVLTAR